MLDHKKDNRGFFIDILEEYFDTLSVYLPHVKNLRKEVRTFSRKKEFTDKIEDISGSSDEEKEYIDEDTLVTHILSE